MVASAQAVRRSVATETAADRAPEPGSSFSTPLVLGDHDAAAAVGKAQAFIIDRRASESGVFVYFEGTVAMSSRLLKAAEAVLIIVLWVTATLSPVNQLAYGYGPLPRVTPLDSWSLAAFGWLGPVAGSFSWYANPMLIVIVVRLLGGRQPGHRMPIVAFALALGVFIPAFVYDFELDGRFHPTFTVGPAVWFWVASFTVVPFLQLVQLARSGFR